ncbi:protein of unknown function [Shinella sp. WSC3-e]|nr:hypothetical protein SHINE37_43127 [Rhizobiaceae bacterium]CAK7257684.1 protein of unknown function [Shinella sp. WSC3-e]
MWHPVRVREPLRILLRGVEKVDNGRGDIVGRHMAGELGIDEKELYRLYMSGSDQSTLGVCNNFQNFPRENSSSAGNQPFDLLNGYRLSRAIAGVRIRCA